MTTQTTQETPPAPPGAGQKQRLSTTQMLHLMRLEVDRALRHDYPISCLVGGLDGFEGEDHRTDRAALFPLLFQELKAVTFENDVRGLGIWADQFLLAVFPHVDPQKLQELADQLLQRARTIDSDLLEEGEGLTVSIGISHNLHPGELSFETIVEEAETGRGLASSGGGDRVVQAKDVERELDRLRDEVDKQIEELHEFQSRTFGDGKRAEETWGKQLCEKVLNLFHRENEQTEGLLRVEKEVLALLKFELAEWATTAGAANVIEAQQTIEKLERRVSKLTQSLGLTEGELKKVAAMKNIDLGLASIYRNVQGLTASDDQFEQKSEMLKNIFEANLAFRAEAAASK